MTRWTLYQLSKQLYQKQLKLVQPDIHCNGKIRAVIKDAVGVRYCNLLIFI